jgi:excisionase family DNA binding protein
MAAAEDIRHEEVIALLKEIRAMVGAPSKTWLAPEQAAVYIGISTISIYRHIRNGSIPHHRIPGTNLIRFHVSELDEWMRTGTITQRQSIDDILRRLTE